MEPNVSRHLNVGAVKNGAYTQYMLSRDNIEDSHGADRGSRTGVGGESGERSLCASSFDVAD